MQKQPVHLSIWDTAGQERFHALGPIYYRDADGALLVYDITDGESFAKVRSWVRELRKIVGNDIVIAIAGNKCDMEKNRHVDGAAALEYAGAVGATHCHTSAKLNKGLDDVFVALATEILKQKSAPGGATLGIRKSRSERMSMGGKKLIIADSPTVPRGQKNKCC